MEWLKSELTVTLGVGANCDAEELLELGQQLRDELLDLDIDAAAFEGLETAPEGAKGVEMLLFGTLAIRLVLNPALLRSVVEMTVAWLARQQARSVKLTLDGDTLEVTGVSSDEQDLLVEQWIARHADLR